MKWWISVAAVTAAALAFGAFKLQTLLIYPSNFPEGSRTQVDTPNVYGIPYEEVHIPTSDGQKLHAFVMAHHPPSPKTVIMFGPNAGNMGHSLPLAQLFYEQMGYNVLTWSYRGYGKSTGQANEKGIKIDAQALLDYFKSSPDLKHSKAIVYGRSLGGAIGIYFATLPGAKSVVSGVIVENTFLSIAKTVPSVMPIAAPLVKLLTERWETEKTILALPKSVPTLFLAGGKDELISPADFKQLFDLCASGTKVRKIYPDGTHNDTPLQDGYWQDIREFLFQVEPEGV